jgi:hypothetical protein
MLDSVIVVTTICSVPSEAQKPLKECHDVLYGIGTNCHCILDMIEPISASVFLQNVLSSPYEGFDVCLLELIEAPEREVG